MVLLSGSMEIFRMELQSTGLCHCRGFRMSILSYYFDLEILVTTQ